MKVLKAFIKRFKTPQRKVKIKISVSFHFSSGIRTERINTNENDSMNIFQKTNNHPDMNDPQGCMIFNWGNKTEKFLQ